MNKNELAYPFKSGESFIFGLTKYEILICHIAGGISANELASTDPDSIKSDAKYCIDLADEIIRQMNEENNHD